MLYLVLFLASLANVVAGLGLAGLYFRFRAGGGVPVIVLLIALSLFVQGAFTIGYVRGWWRQLGDRATQLFVAGESAAALVGTLGTLQWVLYNLHPRNGDQRAVHRRIAAHAGRVHDSLSARRSRPLGGSSRERCSQEKGFPCASVLEA